MERYYPPGVTKEARLRTAIGLFSFRTESERSSSDGRKEKSPEAAQRIRALCSGKPPLTQDHELILPGSRISL